MSRERQRKLMWLRRRSEWWRSQRLSDGFPQSMLVSCDGMRWLLEG